MKPMLCALLFLTAPALAGPLPAPDSPFRPLNMDEVRLGQLLFYDPILSGPQQVACATCHHPRFGTSDGLSLGLGDGAMGLGPDRTVDAKNLPEQRIARNAPALFNLGFDEFTVMFHDGRLEVDATRPSGFRTPLEEDMLAGFDNVVSAQNMFPVLSPDEMAGHYSENDVAKAVRKGHLSIPGGAWDIITARVTAIPAYREGFAALLGPEVEVTFADISNTLAAFTAFEWRADDSPFDRHLRGEAALTGQALEGMQLFYGKAGCDSCHAGLFQTDHAFHAIAMPQIGPGKAERFERHTRDVGRARVTGRDADLYAFRTPSLRNVAHTGPYGHDGAYATLEGVLRHHLDPVAGLMGYDPAQAVLPDITDAMDFPVLSNGQELAAIAKANILKPVSLSDDEIAALLAFLSEGLSDQASLNGRLGIPDSVPSGLPVER